MKLLKQNKTFVFFIIPILIGCVFLLFENKLTLLYYLTFALFVSSFVFFLKPNIKQILYSIFLFTPLSFDYTWLGGVNISFPSELITIALIFIVVIKWFSGLKINFEGVKNPISILLIIDLLWTLTSVINSDSFEIALKRFLIKLIYVVVYYFFILFFLKKNIAYVKLYILYCIGIIIPIIYSFIEHSKYGFTQPTSIYISQPFYVDHTLFAVCLAFIFPIILLLRHSKLIVTSIISKTFIFIVVTLVGFAIFFSYSRAAWLSLVVAVLFYILLKLKVKFYVILSVLLFSFICLVNSFEPIYMELSENKAKYGNDITTHISSVTNLNSDVSNLERVNRWVCAYKMFEDKPILGFGPGTYQFEYDAYQTKEFMTRISTHAGDKGNAHSEYLTALSETGLVGFLILITTFFYSIYLGMKLYYSNLSKEQELLVLGALLGLITFYFHGLFNTFSDIDKLAILYLGSLSVLVHVYNSIKVND